MPPPLHRRLERVRVHPNGSQLSLELSAACEQADVPNVTVGRWSMQGWGWLGLSEGERDGSRRTSD